VTLFLLALGVIVVVVCVGGCGCEGVGEGDDLTVLLGLSSLCCYHSNMMFTLLNLPYVIHLGFSIHRAAEASCVWWPLLRLCRC
jgi:hypothetical protein